MRAVTRLGGLLLAGAIALAPLQALAQEAPPSGNTPAADAVGPRELQNFSLSGTVTRPSEQPVAVQAIPQKRPTRAQAQSASPAPATAEAASVRPASSTPPGPKRTEIVSTDVAPAPRSERVAEAARQSPAPSSSISVALPKVEGGSTAATPSATPASAPVFAPDPAQAGTLAPEHKFPILPWLLAAIALGAGGAFLFWRRFSGREALAGGPQIDMFVAPEAAPAPAPRPAPPPPAAEAPPPAIPGIVSTRLRPWVDIGFQPVRCVLEDRRVVVEFDIELFNSGSAPARAVLVEAILINAGPSQESEIERFFRNPVGQGERIVAIPPLKRVSLRTQVIAPREQIQAYELGGRQVFVPLIAFNTLYRWSGGEGQTSVSYLLGRDTQGEKMGPFRLDLGPRIFRGLAAHLMPTGVRR